MDQALAATDKPTWRRIVDFPLVAMVIALALLTLAQTGAVLAIGLYAGITGGGGPVTDPDALRALVQGPYLLPFAAIEIILSVLVYKLVIRHLGERPRDDLPITGAARDGGHGLLAGAAIMTLVVGVAWIAGVYHVVGDGDWSAFTGTLVGFGLMPGFREELMFRGVLFRYLEEFGGSWAALVVTSLLFGAAHLGNDGATLFSSFCIAVEAGVLLGAVYMLTRNLWMAMGLHAAWNFTQGFVWDVPVSGFDSHGIVTAKLDGPVLLSGGSFGLEASLIALVLATALGLFYLRLAVKRGHVVQPWGVRRRLAREQVSVPSTADA